MTDKEKNTIIGSYCSNRYPDKPIPWRDSNFTSNLDAMHNAECVLTPAQLKAYCAYLDLYADSIGMYATIAPASKRAEAFIKVIEKEGPRGMTREEQDIAIATAIGTHTSKPIKKPWNQAYPDFNNECLFVTDKNGVNAYIWRSSAATDLKFIWPKKYTADLNAIHEVEQLIPWSAWETYTSILERVTGADTGNDVLRYKFVTSATAPQRAEAILRLIGKWHNHWGDQIFELQKFEVAPTR